VPNTLITPSVIAKESLISFENDMVLGGLVHRDYKKEFVKIGSKVSIRKPVRFLASDGATRVNQSVSESTTDITINKRKHVSWTFSMQDLTLTVDEYNKRYIHPATAALANIVDSDLADLSTDFFQKVGTPGVTPATFAVFANAAQKADEQLWPKQRSMVMNPKAQWTMADAFDTNVFSTKLTEDAIRRGALGQIAGFTLYTDANIKTFTPGTSTMITPYVDGAGQTGSSVLLKGNSSGGTWKKGDLVTFAGCYDVNPMSGDAYSHLKQFVITELCTAVLTVVTLKIYPPIITSGAYKTCSASPDDSGVVTKNDTTYYSTDQVRNMAFTKNAMALVMVPLELPQGAAFKARETYKNISIRVVKDYDIDTDEDIIRLDIMYGVKTIYPEMGIVMLG